MLVFDGGRKLVWHKTVSMKDNVSGTDAYSQNSYSFTTDGL